MPASPSKKTGINAELNVSDDLAKIIGTKKGERISRPQVSLRITQHFLKLQFTVIQCVKRLWAYLKEKDLQDPENKQWLKILRF